MRKILSYILIAAAAASALGGCQKTPDRPVVTGKNQERMLDAAKNGGEGSSPLFALEVPERFTGEWTGVDGCVTVHADAEILLPQAEAIPTATVNRRYFTQEDADQLLAALIGDSTLYQDLATKQQIRERIELAGKVQRGEVPASEFGEFAKAEDMPQYIEDLTSQLKDAPDADSPFPASTALEHQEDDIYDESIYGWAMVNGKKMYADIHNTTGHDAVASFYIDGFDPGFCRPLPFAALKGETDEKLTESISESEARAVGDALIKEIGLTDVVCDQASQSAFVQYDHDPDTGKQLLPPHIHGTGYELQYVHCADGFPISYTPIPGTSVPDSEAYAGFWGYELITVWVTGDGVVCFDWEWPVTEPVVQTEDTQLLKFDDIADIFGKMIIIKNSELKEMNERNQLHSTKDIAVDKVRLGLMRIRSKGNLDEGLLIPVWDFWGTVTFCQDDGMEPWDEYTVALTVNAVDGTIIDREFGY